ncbi:MAG: SdrD B-like domain-containing protein, partial [Caldilineaceae bacterium]
NTIMTDTIPAGAIFVSAQGVEGVDWTFNPGTRQLVFLTLPNPIPVGGCVARTMAIRYPVGAVDLPGQINQLQITGTPEGCDVLPANRPTYCGGQGQRTLNASSSFTARVPFPAIDISKSASAASSFIGVEALAGELVTYRVGAFNSGFVNLANVVVSDTIPAQIALQDFGVPLNDGSPVSGFYRTSDVPLVWQPLPGNPYSVAATIPITDLALPGGVEVTALRWELGALPDGAPRWETTVRGRVKPGTPVNTSIVNTARGAAGYLVQTVSDNASATVRVVEPRSIPRSYKSSSATDTVLPGDRVTFTVRIVNEPMAHLPLVNPVMADLLPIQFVYVPASFVLEGKPAGAPDPLFEVIPDYNGTGRTLLRATWLGATAHSLLPGTEFVLRYTVQVREDTPPGPVSNKALIASMGNPEVALACTGSEVAADVNDLDGDGNTTEALCQNADGTGGSTTGVLLSLVSKKFVRGIYDSDFQDFGRSASGSTADYRLVLTNTSNVTVTNIVIVDLLPYIGDQGVIDTSARGSAWRPNLIGPVVGAVGVPLTVFYSASSNPCRPELVADGPIGCIDDWSQTFPLDPVTDVPNPTLVRAIKLDFCTWTSGVRTDTCAVLARNEAKVVEWPMRTTVGAPFSTDCRLEPVGPACQIAWNSFGVTAEGGGFRFRPTEPLKVGVGVAEDQFYAVGDRVWLDVEGLQGDGIQQPTERGLNGVRVELWNTVGGIETLTDATLSANDQAAQPGFFLFNNVPVGNYFLRFFPITGFTASPGNQGANDALDSDGVIPGSDPTFGAYLQTDTFDVGITDPGLNPDLSRDFGLVRVTDYGDAPWDGVAYRYPTRAAVLANPADAARHILGNRNAQYRMGPLRDAEADGQPTLNAAGDDLNIGAVLPLDTQGDDEDGVTLPAAVPGVGTEGGSGAFVRSVAASITIAAVAPTTGTAYLNAWIDWNADGDWDDGGEQVATNVTRGSLGSGTITLPVTAPAGAALGTTYARFRLSAAPGTT